MKLTPIGYVLIDSSTPDGLSHLVSNLLFQGGYELYGQPHSVTYDDGSISFLQAVVELGE